MPRPPYCPESPAHNPIAFAAPWARHRPRVRDLALDFAVRYGRLDRGVLMKACADPQQFEALYDTSDDPTVHKAIYCVELANRPQTSFAIESTLTALLHSAKAGPHPGDGRVWYPHLPEPEAVKKFIHIKNAIRYWEACTPERLAQLPPVDPKLELPSDPALNWGDLYVSDDGRWRVVGFETTYREWRRASDALWELRLYLDGDESMRPLYRAVLERPPVAPADAKPHVGLTDDKPTRVELIDRRFGPPSTPTT